MSDCGNISKCLTAVEEMTPTNKFCSKRFQPLLSAINKSENMEPMEIKRILKMFTHCVKDDIVNLPHALNIVTSMFTKTKSSLLLPIQDYLPSALAILHMIKLQCTSDDKEIRVMNYNTLLAYPVDVLAAIVSYNCSELLEIFTIDRKSGRFQFGEEACYFLPKFIKILPSEQRAQFVKDGLSIWFRDLIPSLMEVAQENDPELQLTYLECVEVVLNDLVAIDYSKCLFWQFEVLKSICHPGEYPKVIKNLLKQNNDIWYRLWIILIKLLKDEITSNAGAHGIPINSMLPVVEAAFKMEGQNRCYAFQCWEVLVETFPMDPSNSSFSKRIKLLLIPLKSNNAKTMSTRLAKFNCWWRIIYVLNDKLDKFVSEVLLDFISFAFGKNSAQGTSKNHQGMAEICPALRQKCIEAYVNIVGHANNCTCQTSLPQLSFGLITSKLLIAHWTDWLFALKGAIRLSVFDYKTNSMELNANCIPIVCAWRQFVLMLAALPDNAIRRDLFSGLIQVLLDLCKDCSLNRELPEFLLSLAVDLFVVEDVIELITSDSEDPPIQKILQIVLNPDLNKFYERCGLKVLKAMLKPMLCEAVMMCALFNKKSVKTKSALIIWTVLVDLLIETDIDLAPPIANMIILWPLEALCKVELDKYAAMLWYKLYNAVEIKLNMAKFEQEFINCLTTDANEKTEYFHLCMTLALLKYKLRNGQDLTFVASIFKNLTSKIYDYPEYEQVLPDSIDAIVLLIKNVIEKMDEELAKLAFDCAKNLLKVIISGIPLNDNTSMSDPYVANVFIMFENLLGSLKQIFQIPNLYSETNIEFVKKLRAHLSTLNNKSAYLKYIDILKEVESSLNSKTNKEINNRTLSQPTIECQIHVKGKTKDLRGKTEENADTFTNPAPNKITKRAKKNIASIVNTIVENGEEYVVVESNWKFNPRKFTEAQKEKLERKRVDIQALCLSQSQDQFNLSTWKTDSQDTSSNSKSVNIENSSTTYNVTSNSLRNIASADVIPKIMENILSEKDKEHSPTLTSALKSDKILTSIETDSKNSPLVAEKKTNTRNTRTPRMSLKDRVSRNLGILMVKSNANNDGKERSIDSPKTNETRLSEKDKEYPSIHSSASKSNEALESPRVTSLEADSGNKQHNAKHKATPINANSPQMSVKDRIVGDRNDDKEKCVDSTKIMQDILPENEQPLTNGLALKQNETLETPLETGSGKTSIKGENILTSQNTNSPRMSLKGRNSRILKILNLQSNPNNSSKEKIVDECPINDSPKLAIPTKSVNDHSNIDTSASSSVSADRPSRMKRKPKKFDDVEVFGLKKRRYSCGYRSDSSEKDANCSKKYKESKVINDNTVDTQDMEDNSQDSQETLKHNKNIPKKDLLVQEITNVCQSNDPVLIESDHPTDAPSAQYSEDIHETPNNVITDTPHKNENYDNENGRKSDSSLKKVCHPNAPNLIISPKPVIILEDILITPSNVISNTPQNVNESLENENKTNSSHEDFTETINSQSVGNNIHNDLNSIQMENNTTIMTTPSPKTPGQQSSSKKRKYKSRIEKQLAIDTVEGHPLLNSQVSNRLTRNNVADSNQCKRKSISEKIINTKTSPNNIKLKETKRKKSSPSINITVADTRDKVDDTPPCSEDFIESSQDSTLTTISLKSTKRTPKRVNNLNTEQKEASSKFNVISHTQDLLQDSDCIIISHEMKSQIHETKDDIELPQNKTAEMDKNESAFTENMDTEPINDRISVENVSLTNDACQEATNEMAITINLDNTVGPESQALAEADTQPNNSSEFDEHTPLNNKEISNNTTNTPEIVSADTVGLIAQENAEIISNQTKTDTVPEKSTEVLSSFNDESQRKQDFLNNTSEISPIKMQGPTCDEIIIVPDETSDDYVVVELSTPVQSNGEPFDNSDSPVIFTEDKISPDKRDESPPRAEVSVNSDSPRSMLSLKKNKPQVRGRGAHMLGLCVPDSLNTIINLEISESEEPKKTTTSTPARKNLRMFYNASEDNNNTNKEDDNFLSFKKSLPSSDSSPSIPILKRKLDHLVDDVVTSPASKRKRVSFHDPPVSTTVSVQKYIDPGAIKSPKKRTDRPLTRNYARSPWRLQNCSVKLVDTFLLNAVQSFTESSLTNENNSMDATPAVEIVKASELNDSDPICPELVNCKDSIENVAVELSSPAMKDLLIKELAGKVDTVGDLAKMTELEVNRLCIKAPKVQIARKVLNDYAVKRQTIDVTVDITLCKETGEETIKTEDENRIEIQDKVMCDNEVQTEVNMVSGFTQTEVLMTDTDVQTKESSFMTTSDVITACLSEREDFIDSLMHKLDEATLKRFAERLSTQSIVDLLATRSEDFAKFDFKTMISFCGQLLHKTNEKPKE